MTARGGWKRSPVGGIAPRLLSLLVLAAGIAVVIIGGTLLWNSLDANRDQQQAQTEARQQAAELEAGIRTLREGLVDESVAEVARRMQQGEAGREDLIRALREAGIRNVLYLVNATEPFELVDLGQLPGGGFAALSMIIEAGEQGRVPAQAHFAGTPDEYLAVAAPLAEETEPRSVLWVALPISMLANQLERPASVDGMVLRQRDGAEPITLQTLGVGVPADAPSVAIEGTEFELAWNRRQFIGPMSLGQLIGVFTAGLLLVALGVLRLRDTSAWALTGPGRFGRKSGPADASPVESAEPVPAPAPPPQAEAALEAEPEPADRAPTDERDAEPAPEPPELTADGEPRRASTDVRELDASDLGSFTTEHDAGGDADESSTADIRQGEDESTPPAGPADIPRPEDDEDEQEAIGAMLRSLMDETDEAVAKSESLDIPVETEDPGPSGEQPPAHDTAGPEPKAPDGSVAFVPDASIFRAYDIRGVVGETLNEDVAEAIGQAIGSEARDRKLTRIAVARDGRLSGAQMLAALSRGLMSTGLEVVDVGAVPTPVLYFAAQDIGGGSGVMVTGSHNPPDYNGFKIVLGGETLAGDAITALHTRLAEGRLVRGEGQTHEARINSQYIERIASDIQLEKPLKVVADCGNGIAGAIAPRLLESIGADVIPLYAEVDGSFPNHHPDPGDPTTLEDLRLCVRNFEADVGVAFDGDGDRLGVVGPDGEIIYPDRLMMLFARDVLSRVPGGEVIYDVKCSSLLAGEIEEAGGTPVMGRTGHSFIKAELKRRQAPLAGEMSGHFFFAERWLGFDDGLYSAARLLEILAADPRATGQVFGSLPKAESTPEIKVPMKEGEPHAFVEHFQEKAEFEGATVNTIDGVRADFSDGFGLVRASNTTPVLVLRFEGTTKDALARIQATFREAMLAVHPSLNLPF